LNVLCIDNTVPTHAESNLDPFGLKTVDRKGCYCRNQNVAVAQVDQSIATYVDCVPHLFDMKPCPHVERGVDQRIDGSRPHHNGIPSTRVGSNWVIVQDACRYGGDRHIFENGCEQIFENGGSWNVETKKAQREKRQIFRVDLVGISGRCLYAPDRVYNVVDIRVCVKHFSGSNVEGHFHVFVGDRICHNDCLVVDIESVRVYVVEFLFGGAQVIDIVCSWYDGIVGNF
jgi:hypothetical protein